MKKFSLFAAFLGGTAIGAAAGILFAPEAGSDTRKKLAEKSAKIVDRIKEALEERGVKINEKDLDEISEELQDELI